MREVVRSGRRANFYTIENSFIDNYAKETGLVGFAVYHILGRHANSDTGVTWIGTAKVAKLLDVHQRTVQRAIKDLENLKLIRVVRTETETIYVIVPVPQKPKTTTTPLFDSILDAVESNEATPMSSFTTPESRTTTPTSCRATAVSQVCDSGVSANKEEQNLYNKTHEQPNLEYHIAAKRILKHLHLSDAYLSAAYAAIEARATITRSSMDDIVPWLLTRANLAERKSVKPEKYLEGFLAESCAEEILDNLNLPITDSMTAVVKKAIEAEVKDTNLSVENVAAKITRAAIEDRGRIPIDRFYFENVKWRQNVRVSKAEQRKLDNLEINARVKERFRERFGGA